MLKQVPGWDLGRRPIRQKDKNMRTKIIHFFDIFLLEALMVEIVFLLWIKSLMGSNKAQNKLSPGISRDATFKES